MDENLPEAARTTAAASRPARPAGLPATSLIIPSRNRPQMLTESVESILQGDEVPTELIIVDQSALAHRALAALTSERCLVTYVWTPQLAGLSRARNTGMAAAHTDIVVFTDDDVLVAPTWFGTLVRALLGAGRRGVVTGQVRPADAEQPGGFAPSTKVDSTAAVYEGRIDDDVLYAGNMAFYRSAITDVGEFDVRLGAGTRYPGAEDNDMAFRLLEAGYRIVYAPDAVIFHRAWRSAHQFVPLSWGYGRGQGAFFAKHLSLRDRHIMKRLARATRTYLRGFVAGVLRGRWHAVGDAVYVLGLFSATGQWLLTERGRGSGDSRGSRTADGA